MFNDVIPKFTQHSIRHTQTSLSSRLTVLPTDTVEIKSNNHGVKTVSVIDALKSKHPCPSPPHSSILLQSHVHCTTRIGRFRSHRCSHQFSCKQNPRKCWSRRMRFIALARYSVTFRFPQSMSERCCGCTYLYNG